ncbi:MAG TPA: Fe-S cluster assembly protein HesB, partial [Thermoanaerobaculia bacterium]|nr:Fe-S cluster assembly protein HesB [Thermoanaerobaculia bacterium]
MIAVAAAAPFSFDTVVRSHGWYDLPPFRYDADAGELQVRARASGGTAELRFRPNAAGVSARGPGALSPSDLRAAASRIFSLSVDLRRFLALAAEDPDLSWAAARGAGRFLRAPSLWEDAVKMLLTTNCSWAATRGMVVRAIDRFGGEGAFPDPEAIARRREAPLNAAIRSGYRTGALLAFARGVASG